MRLQKKNRITFEDSSVTRFDGQRGDVCNDLWTGLKDDEKDADRTSHSFEL